MATVNPWGTAGQPVWQRDTSDEGRGGGSWLNDNSRVVQIGGQTFIRVGDYPTEQFNQYAGGQSPVTYDPRYGYLVPDSVAKAYDAANETFLDKYGVAIAGAGLAAGPMAASMAAGAGGMGAAEGAAGYGAGGDVALSNWFDPSMLTQFDDAGSLSSLLSGAEAGAEGVGALGPTAAEVGETAGQTYLNQLGAPSAGGGGTIDSILSFIKGNPGLVNLAGNLVSGGLGAYGATQAAGIQADAGNAANATLMSMYNQNRADLEPWRQAGIGALGNLTNLTTPGKQLDTAMLDPGYAFRQAEGQKALETQLRAGGKFYSGDALKAGTQYNQNFATGEFGNVFNRNATLAGLGQTATNTGVQSGQTTANNVANNLTGIGDARASGYVGGFNALSGGLSNALRSYQEQSLLEKLLSGRSY